MQAHPLAIIPLQKDLLVSSETSSNSSSRASSPESNGSTNSTVRVRALVPVNGRHTATQQDSSKPTDLVRSEDDTALMRSLISLLPYEQADSQFSVTSPVRQLDGGKAVRNESWFRARPTSSDDLSGNGGSVANNSGAFARGSGGRRGRSGRGESSTTTPFPVSGAGLADSQGLDFLGTTDSVRDLLHLPYTSESVTVGLHRVGKTLVLDGNLGEVLVPTKAPVPGAPPPTPPPNSAHHAAAGSNNGTHSGRRASTTSNAGVMRDGNDDDDGVTKTVGSGAEESRWVMIGKGGKPQRSPGAWGEDREEEHNDDGGDEGDASASGGGRRGLGGYSSETRRSGTIHEQQQKQKQQHKSSRGGGGWEYSNSGRSNSSRQSSTDGGNGEWDVHQGNWPALGSSSETAAATSGDGILSIVPSRPRGGSFGGTRPPEPAGFWRAFQWELAGMRLMLGSSLQVCGTSEHPQVSVRLHDGDEELSLCTCLDYYLDNVMENVPELALCMREKGYIQGCRLVSTEDIPYLGTNPGGASGRVKGAAEVGAGAAPAPLFDPGVVELNATMLLRFLQENCSREGGTYLLHRNEGAAHVQLYDISALSRQRNRRWKWLLAMLCYRFALRISHHTRQPWCRGARSTNPHNTPADVRPMPGPEVVRQLQRRQRQLLENSLELLEELAHLGGGGHETICASVQEHIADTYLGYGGEHNDDGAGHHGAGTKADSRHPDGDTVRESSTRLGPGAGGAKSDSSSNRNGTPRADNAPVVTGNNGDVGKIASAREVQAPGRAGPRENERDSCSQHPVPPPAATEAGTRSMARGSKKKSKRRGGGGRSTKGGDSGAEQAATMGESLGCGGRGGCSGVGAASGVVGSGGYNEGQIFGSCQTQEDLDKAQDHLISGIAILRGVMARQESAAAGRDDEFAGDVVIVGESRLPVAVMRQPSPWLAVDDTDEEEDENDDTDADVKSDRGRAKGGSRRSVETFSNQQDKKHAATAATAAGETSQRSKAGRRTSSRRRGSFDESEDPATAMYVVSEQLWGLQQKLVGTYMAAARVKLGRGFPAHFPSQFSTEILDSSPEAGPSGNRVGIRRNNRRGGDCSRSAGGGGAGAEGSKEGGADVADGPDEETRTELAAGALDSLCAAWEHLAEAMITLDRRVAGALACEEAAKGGRNDDYADGQAAASVPAAAEVAAAEGRENGAGEADGFMGVHQSSKVSLSGGTARDQLPEDLGPLWAGSLSEALARSGGDTEIAAQKNFMAKRGEVSEAPSATNGGEIGTCASKASHGASDNAVFGKVGDLTGSLAWDRAARRQLEARRAELFELCGDVAHACFTLRAAANRGGARFHTSIHKKRDALTRLLPRLEGLLASAHPPLLLTDMDVCHSLHGHVCRALHDRLGYSDGAQGHGATSDPPQLADTCVHSLARNGYGPGDATAWSLCLAAESCYGQALANLVGTCSGGDGDSRAAANRALLMLTAGDGHRSSNGTKKTKRGHSPKWGEHISGSSFDAAAVMAIEAGARLRRKVGDASNELGKLMSETAGLLVQAPVPSKHAPTTSASLSAATASVPPPADNDGCSERSSVQPHPGLACAICVACAEQRFRRSLEEFRAIDDTRNSALMLCNLASVVRLKTRALARLREVCPEVDPETSLGGDAGDANGGGGGTRRDGGRSKKLQGAEAAIEFCGEAHATLGRREVDPRTWDHTSGELAMAYLCLGVERRQELLAALAQSNNAPSVRQARGVVEPLERALQIYSDMTNASQAAACHYQIGQYYAKVFPAYRSSLGSGSDNSSAKLHNLKAWEVGQRAIQHFLAARAYFGPFERGPTSIILALDLCDLYMSLASMGDGAGAGASLSGGGTGGEAVAGGGRGGVEGMGRISSNVDGTSTAATVEVPIPGFSERERSKTGVGVAGETASTTADIFSSSLLRPAAVVRCRCLEGALRSLLETQSVFSGAGVDSTVSSAAVAATRADTRTDRGVAAATTATAKGMGTPATAAHEQGAQPFVSPGALRLKRLLEGVIERLPKVLQGLVRTAIEFEKSPSPSSSAPPSVGIGGGGDTTGGKSVLSVSPSAAETAAAPAESHLSSSAITEGVGAAHRYVKEGMASGGVGANNAVRDSQHLLKRSTVFKSMYRLSLVGMGGIGGDGKSNGAQSVLAALAAEYATVSDAGFE